MKEQLLKEKEKANDSWGIRRQAPVQTEKPEK